MSAPTDPVTAAESPRALAELNAWLATQSAQQRVAWALENTAGEHALSSSFGAQSAVSLHMVTRQAPRTPVIVIDTGYLFPETYRFIDELGERLSLNLKVYRPQIGVAWMEARFGKLWEQGLEGIERYNRILAEEFLYVRTWTSEHQRKKALETWNLHYNYHRPHGAHGGKPPASGTPSRVNNVLASYS